MLLKLEGLRKHFGGIAATDDVWLDFEAKEVHSIIGPNGAGKTTLVAQISGLLKPDAGKIHFDGTEITSLSAPLRAQLGLGRTFQITSVFRDYTALENVLVVLQSCAGHAFHFWRRVRSERSKCEAMEALATVGLHSRADVRAGNLAHGEQRLLEIALALASQPKLLLLDEPTAGMGPEESERVKLLLGKLRGRYTMILIEHDMDAIFRLSDRISVLVYGRIIATGSATEIRANEEVRKAYLGEEEAF